MSNESEGNKSHKIKSDIDIENFKNESESELNLVNAISNLQYHIGSQTYHDNDI